MLITVKVLFRDEQPFEVSSSMTVLQLKGLVNEKCAVPIENQKLLLNGRTLVDNKMLSEYDIQEGSKINVFVYSPIMRETQTPLNPPSLHTLLYNKLRLFYDEGDSLKVADEFMRDFHARLAALSLDDIERMATQYLDEDRANAAASNDEPDPDEN